MAVFLLVSPVINIPMNNVNSDLNRAIRLDDY